MFKMKQPGRINKVAKYLAWPEQRIYHLVSYLDRDLPGWNATYLYRDFYDTVAECNDIADELWW